METPVTIERYTDDLENVLDLLQMSMGLESIDGVRHLMAIEKTRLLSFYRKLGFRLASVVPDWFGDGSVKAIFRLDFGVREGK